MSFQENKFPIVLGAVTAVVAGGLIFWGVKSGGKYSAAKAEYDSTVSEIERLTRGDLYPSTDNQKAKAKNVAEYRADVDKLQKAFDPYRKPKLENVAADVFTDFLLKTKTDLFKQFEDAGTELPDDFFVGLERFTTNPPDRKVTGILTYELEAFADMFGLLAKARPTQLLNVHRPESVEEKGGKFEGKGRYRAHPIEITFSGREASLRDFLGSLDNSENYYYVVRTLRIRNERDTAPNAKDASFEEAKPAAAAAANPFENAGFVFPDDEEEGEGGAEGGEGEAVIEEEVVDEGPTDSGEILKQVLGDELIEVFMRIDVLQFLAPAKLPES